MSIRIEELNDMDFSDVAEGELEPVHPGKILLEDFLQPMGITQYRVAKEIGVQQRRISEIVKGTRAITPDTGLRLSRFFGVNDGFWVGCRRITIWRSPENPSRMSCPIFVQLAVFDYCLLVLLLKKQSNIGQNGGQEKNSCSWRRRPVHL